MQIALGYVFFTGAGALLLAVLPGRSAFEWLESVALAFVLGVGAVSFQLLVYGLSGIPWHPLTVGTPWVLALACLTLWRRKGAVRAVGVLRQSAAARKLVLRTANCGLTPADVALLGGVVLAIALAFCAAATHVLDLHGGEDAFDQYLLKAKAFYVYGQLTPVLGDHTLSWAANLDHPLLISLASLWIYTAAGAVNETAALLLSPLLYTSLLIIFYGLVRRAASRRLALWLTLLLAWAPTAPNLILLGAFTPGYADLPLALYMLCGAGYIGLGIGESDRGKRFAYFTVGGLALGFAALTKNEGQAYLVSAVLISLIVWLSPSRRDRTLLLSIAWVAGVAAVIALPWIAARRIYGLSIALIGHASTGRGPGAILFTVGSLLAHAALYWNVALLALALGLVFEWRGPRRLTVIFIVLVVGVQSALDVAGMLASPLEIHYQVASTAGRLLLQLTPLLFYIIHLTLANDATLAQLMAPAESTFPLRAEVEQVVRPSQDAPEARAAVSRPEASIVLPTHGRRDSLLRVLRALGRQSVRTGLFEVLVICDGDVDGSAAACRELSPALPYTLRVLEQTNQGPAVARNRGVEESRAPLIVFLDDDVVPDERLIETHLAAHRGDDQCITIGPLLPPSDCRLNAWGEWEERALCRQYDDMTAGKWKVTYRQFYTGNAAVLKRHILKAGGFNAAFRRAEDVELALRLRDRGLRFVFLPEARGWHFVRRTFDSWQRMATAYGAADVAMARDGRPELLAIVASEYPSRNRLVRMLTAHCVGRPLLLRPLVQALGMMAQGADMAHLSAPGNLACSLIFNLRYYDGLARALGGRSALLKLLRGEHQAALARSLQEHETAGIR
jgi:GT2 family glycosyltransferase